MKKIITILVVIGMFSLQGCTINDSDTIDNDTIAEVFQLNNASFSYNVNDGYNIYEELNPILFDEDVILIYRKIGSISGTNAPIWQLIPRTIFLDNGRELDYDFDFSVEDFTIYARGNYDLSLTPQYLNNQTFRIVIVPGSKSGSAKYANKNAFSDYNAVIKMYKIDDSKVKILN
jgi:hypothetical protein